MVGSRQQGVLALGRGFPDNPLRDQLKGLFLVPHPDDIRVDLRILVPIALEEHFVLLDESDADWLLDINCGLVEKGLGAVELEAGFV